MSQIYNNILVGVDGSKESENAFDKAVEIAKRNEAKLLIAHIVDIRSFTTAEAVYEKTVTEHAESYANELLGFFEKKAKEAGLSNVELHIGYGSPKFEMTNKIAPENKVDLIICGATGVNAIERFIIGSVSEYIVRHAKCDVLVVRSNG